MLYCTSQDFFAAILIVILVCELFIPYKKRLFLSLAAGNLTAIVFCEFSDELFLQCAFMLCSSFAVYGISLAVTLIRNVSKQSRRDIACVIALCDMPENGYGAVYGCGREYVIKNRFGRAIKKGEALRMKIHELDGEKIV